MKDIIDIKCVKAQDFEYYDYLPDKCKQKKFLMYNENCDVCFMVDDKFINKIKEDHQIEINTYEEEKKDNSNENLYSKKCINKLNDEALDFINNTCKKSNDETLSIEEFIVFKSNLKKKVNKYKEKIDIINSLIEITSNHLDNKDTKFLKNIYNFNS